MFSRLSKFIIKIRESEEDVKKRWLVILSGSVMLLVVFLWMLYFNLTVLQVPTIAENADPAPEKASPVKESGKLANLGKTLMSGFNAIKEKITYKNSITITNIERNFLLDNNEEIPKTKLP